jgi:hypothetical protein
MYQYSRRIQSSSSPRWIFDSLPSAPSQSHFTVEYNCAKILGSPKYNSEDHPAIATRILLEKKIKLLSALRNIAPHSVFLILRYVINQRASYLSRLSEFDESRRCFSTAFDQPIDDFIAQIAHCNPLSPSMNQIRKLRSLPLSLGGLGIRRYSGPDGIVGVKRSRLLTLNFLCANIPLLADTVENSSWPILTLPSFVDLTDLHGQELSTGCHASKELSDTARQWEKHSI